MTTKTRHRNLVTTVVVYWVLLLSRSLIPESQQMFWEFSIVFVSLVAAYQVIIIAGDFLS